MKRRTFRDVDAHARAHERVGVHRAARRHVARLRVAVTRGRMSEEVAALAIRQVELFAADILTGLHIDDWDNALIRPAVRRMLEQENGG